MQQEMPSPMRKARIRLGLTLAQVAAKCDERGVAISEGALSRIERGQYSGRPETRAALAAVLGLDAHDDFEVNPSEPADEPADPPPARSDLPDVRDEERPVPSPVSKLQGPAVADDPAREKRGA